MAGFMPASCIHFVQTEEGRASYSLFYGPAIEFLPASSFQPMNQKDQTKKERGYRYCAQQEQRRQGFFETEAANAAAQSGYIPGMPFICLVIAASADQGVGEGIFASWRVVVGVDQLRRQLPTAKGA